MSRVDVVKDILYQQLESKCFGYKKKNAYDHLFGTSSICGFLALKNNLDPDLASIIGLFHDYSTYITGNSLYHATRSSEYTKKILMDTHLFNDNEIEVIVNAIKNHSNKDKTDDKYSELIKDADVIHQYLQQTDAVFSKDYELRLTKYKQ